MAVSFTSEEKDAVCNAFFSLISFKTFCAETLDNDFIFVSFRFVLFIVFINGELIFAQRQRMAQVKAKGVPFSTKDENVDQNSA